MSHNLADTIERLENKSKQQYFGYELNFKILQVYDSENGSRDIDKEYFVSVNELGFDDEWLPTFYQDIIDGKIDTKCSNFWERWDYYRQNIPDSEQPSNYQKAKDIVLPLKKTHGKTAQTRKQRVKQQRLNELLESVKAEKNLSDLDPQALAQWQEEAIIEAVYNALLLEKSTTRQMVEVKAMSREAILTYVWNNQKTDHYSDKDYEEVRRIYATFKLAVQLAKACRMLTNEEVIKIYHQLVGDDTTLPYIIKPNHPTVSKMKIKALAKYIDSYNQEKEQVVPLVAIARFYAALVGSKLFKSYHETMLTAIVNLELQKYGYPFIAIRRRDLFFIESLGGRYYLHNNEPQNYVELIGSYVEVELLCIHDYLDDLKSIEENNTVNGEYDNKNNNNPSLVNIEPKITKPIINKQLVFQQDGNSLTKRWTWQVGSILPLTNTKESKLLQVLITGEYFNGGGLSTIITPQGERLFAEDFNYLSNCAHWHYESKYIKVSRPNQGYGLLDHQGKQVVDTIYDSLGTPIDNQVNGSRDDKKYTIDLTTHEETPIKNGKDYQRLGHFSEGLCKVSTLPRMDNFSEGEYKLAYHSDFDEIAGYWGFINRQGEEVVAPEFIYANEFEGGIAVVCKGKWYKDPKWDNKYNQGRYWTDTELWGAIDTKGNIAIPFIFDEINFFSDWSSNGPISNAFKAHIGGWQEGHWGVIDNQGNWLAEPIFEDIGYWYDNGVFDFYDKNRWHDEVLIGLYDINQQKVIFEPKYSDVDLNGNGTFDVEYTDEYGKTVKQTLYFDGTVAPTRQPYRYMPSEIRIDDSHIIKQSNGTVIVHDRLQENEQYFKLLQQNEKWGLCTRFGQIVLPIIYRSMFIYDDNFVICQDDDHWQCFEISKNF